MSHCSPNINVKDHYTCFSYEELEVIAKAFNKENEKQQNIQKNIVIDLNKNYTKKELWNEIYDKLNNVCKYEYCWIDLKFIDLIKNKDLKQKIKFFTFKPKMTIKQYSWLSTNDINYVLKQYEKIDKNFKFIGALPSDFYKVIPKQVLIDMYKDILNYRRIGYVFNLDTHDKSGSHWVSLYIDKNTKTIEYFDSLGKEPNKYIKKFIRTILKKYPYKLLINKIVHQKENSECGVYSIYFIIHRLFDESFEHLTNNRIKDKDMNQFRFNIFRPRE